MAWKAYHYIQTERAQTADQPGQVVDHVADLPLSVFGVLQQHTQAISCVPHDDQCKQEERHTLCRLSLILPNTNESNGEVRFSENETKLHLSVLAMSVTSITIIWELSQGQP